MNIIAIQSGSRVPEVVEWYYQHQGDVAKRNAFLANEVVLDLHYVAPGRMGVQSVSKFTASVRVVNVHLTCPALTFVFCR